MPGEVEDVLEEERRDPERRAEGEDHRPDQHQRRDHRAQQRHEDQEHQDERDRRRSRRLSRAADWRRSYSSAVGPPTSAASPPAALADVADARDEVEACGAERILVEGRLELGPGRALLLARADLGDPGRPGRRLADRVERGPRR